MTQRDPLSMMLYAIAALPLIHSLEDSGEWVQNWYTDVLGNCFCKEVVGQLMVLHIDTFLSLPKLLWLFSLQIWRGPMTCSMILMFVWSLFQNFLKHLWESNHWWLILFLIWL